MQVCPALPLGRGQLAHDDRIVTGIPFGGIGASGCQ